MKSYKTVLPNGTILFFKNGTTDIIHNEYGPAKETSDGTKYWYIDGKRHREDGPAIEWEDGERWWYKNDQLHRDDGPAVEIIVLNTFYANLSYHKEWFKHGKRHREDGPAVEYADGVGHWWYNNERIYCKSQKEFLKLLKLKVFW